MSRTVASVLRSRSFGATGLQALMRRFFHYRLAYTFHAHAAATATTLRLLTSSWRSLCEGRGRKSGGQQPYWTSTRAVHNSSLTGTRDELRASFAYVEKRAVDFKMKVDEVKAEIKELEDGRDWKSLTTAEKNRLSCLMDKLIVLLDEEKLLLEKRSLLRKQLAALLCFKEEKQIIVTYGEETHVVSIPSTTTDFMQHIVNTIQKEGTALPHDDAFELVSSRGIFLDYGCLVDGEQYTLQQRHKLEVKPASNWGDYELDVLRIHVKEVDLDSFIRQIWNEDVIVEPSSSSVILEDDLMTLSDESLQLYASEEFGILSASALHRDPLVKALHLTDRVSKFEAKSNYEAAANAFLRFLLPRVGFTRGMLFPIPKLSLRLHYSRCEYVTARADFVILDLLSDCRMAVFEDKYTDSGRSDSTPQLIAEAIAAHQHNFRKAHGMSDICFMLNERAKKYTFCDPFFGVRVFGSKFQFFVIPVSAAIMKAMETRMRAEGPTTIFKLASKSELDFKIPSDRALIIKLLDQMRQNIEIKGAKSSQRNAMMLKTAK